jgi:nitrite reductase (NO-forming)
MLNIRKNAVRALVPVATLALLAVGIMSMLGARGNPTVERVDFAKTITATSPAFDAALAPVSRADVKEFRIPIEDATINIADGVTYRGWTFGGTVPGPVIRARVGDLVRVTVVNESQMMHSIDFHSARIPANVAYRAIMPHDSITFEFTPRDPGAFLVHCGTPPVTLHLMQGMYLAMIVDPRGGWGTEADKEFVIVQSEFYSKPAEHHEEGTRGMAAAQPNAEPDWQAAMSKQASYVVFNGRASQYKANPLQVDVGDRVRFFVVNSGPSFDSDFHIVGAIFDRVYPDGNPDHVLENIQTYMVPSGGGAIFETVFEEGASGEGIYAFVTHSFADAEKGAVGMIKVGSPKQFATMSH